MTNEIHIGTIDHTGCGHKTAEGCYQCCYRCNYDMHWCRICKKLLSHGIEVCEDCKDAKVDENGCPVEMAESGNYSAHAPESPCRFCTGDSACRVLDGSRLMTSWEWCQEMNTCAATVEWDKISGRA